MRISELQVFSSRTVAGPPVAVPPVTRPPVVVAPGAPTLPTTGGLPLALGSLLLLALAGAVHRGRRAMA